MVAKKLLKESIISVKKNKKRFITIMVIIFLGVGIFCGMNATIPDLQKTADTYFDDNNFMNIRVISTLGLTNDDIDTLKREITEIDNIEASYTSEAITTHENTEMVATIHSLNNESDINNIQILTGKMPTKENECLIDASFVKLHPEYEIGNIITITDNNINLKNTKYTIVGTILTPLYISYERGTTSLLNGKIDFYLFIPETNFDTDYYTEAFITIKTTTSSTFSDSYKRNVKIVKDKINEIASKRALIRYNEVYDKYNNEIILNEKTYNEEKTNFDIKIANAQQEIDKAKKDIDDLKYTLEHYDEVISKYEKELQQKKNQLEQAKKEYNAGLQEYNTKSSQANTALRTLNFQKSIVELEISNSKNTINFYQRMINNNRDVSRYKRLLEEEQNTLKEKEKELEDVQTQINTINNKLNVGKSTLDKAKKDIEVAEKEIATAEKELNSKKMTPTEIANAKKEINVSLTKLNTKQEELNQTKADGEEELKSALYKIADAKDTLKELKNTSWYILDRNENIGFYQYTQDLSIIDNISKIFPIIFFIVAAMVSLSSMTRMVEEERIQIGTLKALGYNNKQITIKYILYALIATLCGSILGMIVGFIVIPKLIYKIYALMYVLPNIVIQFNIKYAIIGLVIATVCTTVATYISCKRELTASPAILMLPKAPQPGKRVFLEQIPKIWEKLKFSQKITIRNMFRYKKKFLTTLVGISGCTALIIVGFALRSAITDMIPYQYGKIFKAQIQINLKDNVDRISIKEEIKRIEKLDGIKGLLPISIQTITVKNGSNTYNVQLTIPENTNDLNSYITLRDRNTQKIYNLNNDSIIITEKLAILLNVSKNDTISITKDNVTANLKISNITENYIGHSIYMTENYYKTLFDSIPKYNVIYAKAKDLNKDEEIVMSKLLNETGKVSGLTFISYAEESYKTIMSNMNLIVGILIISSGLLAFVVLYNLFTINISERTKELATIKVLGFTNKEVNDYIANETKALTILGIIFGIIFGSILAKIVIKTCELDNFMFNYNIPIYTYVYAAALTVVFSVIVNYISNFTIKKINMIESLKSYE